METVVICFHHTESKGGNLSIKKIQILIFLFLEPFLKQGAIIKLKTIYIFKQTIYQNKNKYLALDNLT